MSSHKTYEVRVHDNDDICWYLDGKLHRVDGPAIIRANGYKEWYLDGKRHRVNGPAITWVNGTEFWYLDGKRHRVDGPAITYPDGTKYWYLDGKKLSEAEHQTYTQKQPELTSCQGRTVVIDGIAYRLEVL